MSTASTSGAAPGALALALAPHVADVVGVDRVPELLELARERAPANATFVEGDAERLTFDDASFDLAGTLRTLHHVPRPELVLAELARVTRRGGRVLVIDQLAPADPLDALAVDRFERARDEGHTRLLPGQRPAPVVRGERARAPPRAPRRRAPGARRLPRSRRLPGRRASPRARAGGARARGHDGRPRLVPPGATVGLAGTVVPGYNTRVHHPIRRGLIALAAVAAALVPLSAAQGGAFSGDNGPIAFTCGSDICKVNPDGSGRTTLLTGATDPSWSSDETQIAFVRPANGRRVSRTPTAHRRCSLAAGATSTQPSFSFSGAARRVREGR